MKTTTKQHSSITSKKHTFNTILYLHATYKTKPESVAVQHKQSLSQCHATLKAMVMEAAITFFEAFSGFLFAHTAFAMGSQMTFVVVHSIHSHI